MKTDVEKINTRVDLADRIARCMHRQNISRSELADKLGCSKANITKFLSGDTNLQIDSIVAIFSALNARVELAVTPHSSDEWLVKKQLLHFENSLWPSDEDWIPVKPKITPSLEATRDSQQDQAQDEQTQESWRFRVIKPQKTGT